MKLKRKFRRNAYDSTLYSFLAVYHKENIKNTKVDFDTRVKSVNDVKGENKEARRKLSEMINSKWSKIGNELQKNKIRTNTHWGSAVNKSIKFGFSI